MVDGSIGRANRLLTHMEISLNVVWIKDVFHVCTVISRYLMI